jgi:hypothetical protein
MIFVIAELTETAIAASLAFTPDFLIARLIAPATSSTFSIRPSTTELSGNGSTANDSTLYLPFTWPSF